VDQQLEQGLRDLLDKQEITDVILRYQRAIDRRDVELMHDCFWPGATMDYGNKPYFTGLASDFIEFSMGPNTTREDRPCLHAVLSSTIELHGDLAFVESPYIIMLDSTPNWEQGRLDYIVIGRYLDRFQRRDGVWKIRERAGVHDFSRISLPPSVVDMFAVGMPVGKKSKEDLSYTWYDSLPPVE